MLFILTYDGGHVLVLLLVTFKTYLDCSYILLYLRMLEDEDSDSGFWKFFPCSMLHLC